MSLFFKGIKLQIQGIYDFEKDPSMVQTKLFQYPKRFYENYEVTVDIDEENDYPNVSFDSEFFDDTEDEDW